MSLRVAQLPWQLTDGDSLPDIHRTGVICPGKGTCLVCSGAEDLGALRDFAWHVGVATETRVVLELPGPATRGPETRALRIGTAAPVVIPFAPDALPVWHGGPEVELEVGHKQYDGMIDGLLARMQEMGDFVRDQRKEEKSRHAWWPEIVKELMQFTDGDRAGRGLIVAIAGKMLPHLREIASTPKRALRRVREGSRIDRVQELDVHCLLDYAQRPGRTPAEKAGQKQRLLSVTRQETLNTLENRVTLDFCRRSLLAVRRYREQNSSIKETTSKRLLSVVAYGRSCRAYLRDPAWDGVVPLAEPCRAPNYVLAQNPRYVEVWREYLNLLRYADLREIVWRWPRRAWADVLRTVLGAEIRLCLEGLQGRPLAKKPVRIGKAIVVGSWFRNGDSEGDWRVKSPAGVAGCLYLVERSRIAPFSRCPELALCNADYYLAWLPDGTSAASYVPVWAMLGDVRWRDAAFADSQRRSWMESAAQSLNQLQVNLPPDVRLAGGLIARADWMAPSSDSGKPPRRDTEHLQVPVWLWESRAFAEWGADRGALEPVLERLLGHASRD